MGSCDFICSGKANPEKKMIWAKTRRSEIACWNVGEDETRKLVKEENGLVYRQEDEDFYEGFTFDIRKGNCSWNINEQMFACQRLSHTIGSGIEH